MIAMRRKRQTVERVIVYSDENGNRQWYKERRKSLPGPYINYLLVNVLHCWLFLKKKGQQERERKHALHKMSAEQLQYNYTTVFSGKYRWVFWLWFIVVLKTSVQGTDLQINWPIMKWLKEHLAELLLKHVNFIKQRPLFLVELL